MEGEDQTKETQLDLPFSEDNRVETEPSGQGDDLHEGLSEDKVERISKLPLARIKHIMKMDPEVSLASQDAVFLISKTTELFIQTLAKEAFVFTSQNKKKTMQKKDVESAVSASDTLVFLEGALDF